MRILFLLILLFAISRNGFADDVIHGHYCYTYGDRESVQEARELTRSLAIRNAIESYRIFVISTSNVKNFQLTNDLIQMISSGYLKDIQVVNHKEEGRMICDDIKASISPEAIENIINSAKQRTEKIENIAVANNGYLRILGVRKIGTRIEVIVEVLRNTGSLWSVPEQNSKPFFKICIDFFDSNGNPIGGASEFIHSSPTEVVAKEIRRVIFSDYKIPQGASSWKVWLPSGR